MAIALSLLVQNAESFKTMGVASHAFDGAATSQSFRQRRAQETCENLVTITSRTNTRGMDLRSSMHHEGLRWPIPSPIEVPIES